IQFMVELDYAVGDEPLALDHVLNQQIHFVLRIGQPRPPFAATLAVWIETDPERLQLLPASSQEDEFHVARIGPRGLRLRDRGRDGCLRWKGLHDLIQRLQIRQGRQVVFLGGLDQIVGQDRDEIVVLLPELSVSHHHPQPLLGVSLTIRVVFILNLAERGRDARQHIIFTLPQNRKHQAGELETLRQALRISLHSRSEDRPLLTAEFFLKVVRRVEGDENAALLQRGGQLIVPDGRRLYLRAVEESNIAGRPPYLIGDVFTKVFVKPSDKTIRLIVFPRIAEKK